MMKSTPGEVLERADVATLPADDPPLHVVGGELDDADRRLGRVARGDALQGVGDERPRAALGVGAGLLLELPHGARELVPDQVLGALEELLARLAERQPADALELAEHLVVAGLELLLELLRVRLAVGDPLLAARELLALRVELRLALVHALLDLRHLQAAVLDLRLDLGAERDRLLACLDLRLAPRRLGLALGVGEDRPPLILREPQPRRARRPEPDPQAGGADRDSDHCCDDREHGRSLSGLSRGGSRGCSHPDTACTAASRSTGRAALAISVGVPSGERRSCRSSSWFGWDVGIIVSLVGFGKALCAGEMSDEACLS